MAITRRALVGGVAGAVGARTAASQGRARPNIVFFMADDLGYADVSCYGRPDIATPAVDRIAADGVRFLQGYANSAVCSATRTALITGRYQYRLPVGLEEPVAGSSRDVGVPASQPTLPSLLKAAGYGTTLLGKWHLGKLPAYGPLQNGYEHFWGFRGGGLDYFTHLGVGHEADLWDGDMPVQETGYMTDLLGDRAVRAIESYAAERRPFLLSVHFNAPHWPWEGPDDAAEAERLRTLALRDFDGGTQRTYKAMVERMDFQIGRVLAALDRLGLAEDTIVAFTSDNGGERFADTWPFTGRKTELLEGGLRVPMVMRWPARVRPGQVSDQVAISMDWLPTLLAAAGVPTDPAFAPDGMNLLPMVTDGHAPVARQLFWRFKANHQRAVRDGDWKLLKIGDNTFLFDVAADPMERANLRERHREVYDRLVTAWNGWNAQMLPEVRASFTEAITAQQQADHIGAQQATGEPDTADGWPAIRPIPPPPVVGR